jgi:integrase
MAPKVTIVIRVTNSDGKRSWVPATGKQDPEGPLYLRHTVRSQPKYVRALDIAWNPCKTFIEAQAAKVRLERELKIVEAGGIVPQAAPVVNAHRIADCIESYIQDIQRPDKNGDCRSAKSVRSAQSELKAFHAWSKKTYMHELTKELMMEWRDELNAKYEPDTVVNKLMRVAATWWKQNPLCPRATALLPVSEFPDKKETIPDPYTQEEYEAMMDVATDEERLLLYMFAVTGMREQEIANARRENINFELGVIYVVKDGEFKGKNKSARREVELPDDLLAEFKLRGPGLLFPSAHGGAQGHFLRIIEAIAEKAGVTPTTGKPYMVAAGMCKDDWCHRWRDTYLTNQLHEAKSMADLLSLCKRVGHRGTETLNKYFGKLKRPYAPTLKLRRVETLIKEMEVENLIKEMESAAKAKAGRG